MKRNRGIARYSEVKRTSDSAEAQVGSWRAPRSSRCLLAGCFDDLHLLGPPRVRAEVPRIGGRVKPERRCPPATWGPFADAVICTQLGFATLWLVRTMAYSLGIATRGFIVGAVGSFGAAGAWVMRRQGFGWVRARLSYWALTGGAALAGSLLPPTFTPGDDSEYFFLINKLLGTGSVIEYFNYHRPLTLGGWTFLQAMFSAGPASVGFVASIDALVGSIFFLLAALMLGVGAWSGLTAAFCWGARFRGLSEQPGNGGCPFRSLRLLIRRSVAGASALRR
jgi:hypothetical protein